MNLMQDDDKSLRNFEIPHKSKALVMPYKFMAIKVIVFSWAFSALNLSDVFWQWIAIIHCAISIPIETYLICKDSDWIGAEIYGRRNVRIYVGRRPGRIFLVVGGVLLFSVFLWFYVARIPTCWDVDVCKSSSFWRGLFFAIIPSLSALGLAGAVIQFQLRKYFGDK